MMNFQFYNVGNTGDVIKHVSLVAILNSIKKNAGELLYAETHSFYPEAPIGIDVKKWQVKEANLPSTEAYNLYLELEKPFVSQKPSNYLCSVGIAKYLLAKYSINTNWILCEKDNVARQKLAEYIPSAIILDNNKNFSKNINDYKIYDSIVCLVDPRSLEYKGNENSSALDLFPTWSISLSNALKRNGNLIILSFDYGPEEKWPELPNLGKPIAKMTKKIENDVFKLAVYLSPAANFVLNPLRDLGWMLISGQKQRFLAR